MRAGGVAAEPHDVVRSAVRGLEAGDYTRLLDPERGVVAALGAGEFAGLTPLMRAVADGQWTLARGDVAEARQQFGDAVLRHLPAVYHQPGREDGVPRTRLRPVPVTGPASEIVIARLARVLWREQYEIDHLYGRSVAIEPAEALAEAVREEATWTSHDVHFSLAVLERRHTRFRLPPTRQRAALCRRATQLVRLDRPTAGSVTDKTWRTARGYDGLFADVLDDLAAAPSPVPWSREPGARCVPVRPGRLRLWEQAGGAQEDRKAWS